MVADLASHHQPHRTLPRRRGGPLRRPMKNANVLQSKMSPNDLWEIPVHELKPNLRRVRSGKGYLVPGSSVPGWDCRQPAHSVSRGPRLPANRPASIRGVILQRSDKILIPGLQRLQGLQGLETMMRQGVADGAQILPIMQLSRVRDTRSRGSGLFL